MDFYAFVEGPLLWVAFLIFIIGTLARAALFLFTSYKMDKIIYQHFSLKYILSSLVRWLLPLNKSVPKNPLPSLPYRSSHMDLPAHYLLGVVSLRMVLGFNSSRPGRLDDFDFSGHRTFFPGSAHLLSRYPPSLYLFRLLSACCHRDALSNRIFSHPRNFGRQQLFKR